MDHHQTHSLPTNMLNYRYNKDIIRSDANQQIYRARAGKESLVAHTDMEWIDADPDFVFVSNKEQQKPLPKPTSIFFLKSVV